MVGACVVYIVLYFFLCRYRAAKRREPPPERGSRAETKDPPSERGAEDEEPPPRRGANADQVHVFIFYMQHGRFAFVSFMRIIRFGCIVFGANHDMCIIRRRILFRRTLDLHIDGVAQIQFLGNSQFYDRV